MSGRCLWWTAAVVLVLGGGCSRSVDGPITMTAEHREEPLVDQITAVLRGDSDRIYLAKTKVTDADVPLIATAVDVRELLLDESELSSEAVEQLSALEHLEHLRLRGRPVDDRALVAAARIMSLRVLNLPQGEFTDDGVKALCALPNLVQLRLGSEHLTDRSLREMMDFPALARIHLLAAPITDEGLAAVHGNKRLESLYLDGSHVTESGLGKLFAALPELHVHVNQKHADSDPQGKNHSH